MGPLTDTQLSTSESRDRFAEVTRAERQVDDAFEIIARENDPQFVENLRDKDVNQQAISGSRLEANAAARSSAETLEQQVPSLAHVLAYGRAIDWARKGAANPAPVLSTGRINLSRKTW